MVYQVSLVFWFSAEKVSVSIHRLKSCFDWFLCLATVYIDLKYQILIYSLVHGMLSWMFHCDYNIVLALLICLFVLRFVIDLIFVIVLIEEGGDTLLRGWVFCEHTTKSMDLDFDDEPAAPAGNFYFLSSLFLISFITFFIWLIDLAETYGF